MKNEEKIIGSKPPYPWVVDNRNPKRKILRQILTKEYLDSMELEMGAKVEYATPLVHGLGYYLRHNQFYVELEDTPCMINFILNQGQVYVQPAFDERSKGEKYRLSTDDDYGELCYLLPIADSGSSSRHSK